MPARKKPVEDSGRSVAAVLQEKTKTLGLLYQAVAETQITNSYSSATSLGSSSSGVDNVARPDFGRGKSRKVSEDLEALEPFA